MKKLILILISALFSQLSNAQNIYVYGEINDAQIDSITDYLNDIFLNNKKAKKVKIYFTSYQSNGIANCVPFIATKKKFRNEIISYYSTTLENQSIEFDFDKMNQIKNELTTIYENTEIQVLDKCEMIRKRSSDKINIYSTLKIGTDTRSDFIDIFSSKNALVLMSFYIPTVKFSYFKIDNSNIQFINNSCNTLSIKKDIEITGLIEPLYCKLKSIIAYQGSKTIKIPINNNSYNTNISCPFTLKKGINYLSIVVTYANNLSVKASIEIDYLGEEKINFVTPSKSGSILEICQSNQSGKYKLKIQFETRIAPNLLTLNLKSAGDGNYIESKSTSILLSNYEVEDISTDDNEKTRKYCFFLNAVDVFEQLISKNGYNSCLWSSETTYTLFFTMSDSGIRASKEMSGIVIMDAGEEGPVRRPICKYCN
jgi:hypothetical protein